MWGRKPNSESAEATPTQPYTQPEAHRRVEPAPAPPPAASTAPRQGSFQAPAARIGMRLKFNGEITGTEDLQVDGDFKGKIELNDNCLTIGPNARVEADVHARSICIHGRLKGHVEAPERIELRKTGSLEGDVVTAGIVIEEGAVFRGSIDIVKPEAKAAAPPVKKTPVASAQENSAPPPVKSRKEPEQASVATA